MLGANFCKKFRQLNFRVQTHFCLKTEDHFVKSKQLFWLGHPEFLKPIYEKPGRFQHLRFAYGTQSTLPTIWTFSHPVGFLEICHGLWSSEIKENNYLPPRTDQWPIRALHPPPGAQKNLIRPHHQASSFLCQMYILSFVQENCWPNNRVPLEGLKIDYNNRALCPVTSGFTNLHDAFF